MKKSRVSKRRRFCSFLLAVLLTATLLPGQAISAAAEALQEDADISVRWSSDKETYSLTETADLQLRVELSEWAKASLESVTVKVSLSPEEYEAVREPSGTEPQPSSGDGNYTMSYTFSNTGEENWTRELQIQAPANAGADGFEFDVATGDIAVSYQLKSKEAQIPPENESETPDTEGEADTSPAETPDPNGDPSEGGTSSADGAVPEEEPVTGGEPAPAEPSETEGSPDQTEPADGQLEAQLVVSQGTEDLIVVKEGVHLTFRNETEPAGEQTFALALTTEPATLKPESRQLPDFTVTAKLTANAAKQESGRTTVRLGITLPEKLAFPAGNNTISENQILVGDRVLAEIEADALPEGTSLTSVSCEGNTLYIEIGQSWGPDTESQPPEEDAAEESTLLETAGEVFSQLLRGTRELSWSYPITIHGEQLEMEEDFRTGTITARGEVLSQEAGSGSPAAAASATISIEEETVAPPEGLNVTERLDSLPQTIYWVDNRDEAGNRPDTSAFQETPLYYQLDGTGEWTLLTPANMAELGFAVMPVPAVSDNGNGVYTVTYRDLPSKLVQNDPESDVGEPLYTHTVQWKFAENPPAVDGYAEVPVTEANWEQYPSAGGKLGWYYVLETDFVFTLRVRWGTLGRADGLRDLIMKSFALYISTAEEGTTEQAHSLQKLEEDGVLQVDFSQSPDQDNPTIGVVTISGGWKYNLDGTPINFYVDTAEKEQTELRPAEGSQLAEQLGEDYFLVSYDNTSAPNVGSITTEVYDGGTAYVTLTGTTTYQAKKVWADDDSSRRPGVEFHLWRYREGASYTTAAPVTDSSGRPYILKYTSGETEAAEDDTQQIVFLVQSTDGPVDAELEKYDPEGYRYIYVVREYIKAEADDDPYEQIFGAVDPETGEVQDTLDKSISQRADGDRYVYNGGTITNHRSDTVTTVVRKIWNASAFQSQLEDVTLEFTLQSRPLLPKEEEPTGEEADWENTGIVMRETGFSEEELSLWSHTESVYAYGDDGELLEYRWVETGVYQGDSGENLLNEDGTAFTLTQDGRKVTYRVEIDEEEAGTYQATIINSVAEELDYQVVKVWEKGTNLPEEGEYLTFNLYQIPSGSALTGDANPYLTFTWNGTVVAEGSTWPDGITLDEMAVIGTDENGNTTWTVDLHSLPEFDENGQEYEYLLLEDTTGTAYYPTYETTRDEDGNYVTRVINGPGEGNRITVRKVWIDGGDSAHRGDVTIAVFERGTNAFIKEVTLGAGVWSAQVGLGFYEDGTPRDVDDVYILETSVSASQGEQADVYQIPVRPYQIGAETDPQYDEPTLPNYGASESYQYETLYHRYEATYQERFELAGETFYTVTNRRLGSVDLTVTKTWDDGDGTLREALAGAIQHLEDGARLTPYIQLDFTEETRDENYAIKTDGIETENDSDTVNLGGADTPILNEEREPTTALQEIDLEESSQTFHFYGLPKYDVDGSVVRYTVREVWLDASGKHVENLSEYFDNYLPENYEARETLLRLLDEFSSSVVETAYDVNPDTPGEEPDAFQDDVQKITVTNALREVKTIYWHKLWKDTYTLENNQRPDIYLDIYRVYHVPEEDGKVTTKVEPYIEDYRWEYSAEGSSLPDGPNDANTFYHWHAVITGVPKYDDLGYEIQYYAVERSSVDTEDFDYLPAAYSMDGEHTFGTAAEVDEGLRSEEYVWNVSETQTPEYALREGGFFTNSLSSTVTIQGQKLWNNLPSGYPSEDLPTVTFKLDRTHTVTNQYGDKTESTEPGVATLVVSDWADLYRNGTYVFRIEYEGENVMEVQPDGTIEVKPSENNTRETKLPRYDSNGGLYTYTLVETSIDWPESVKQGEAAATDWRNVYEKPSIVANTYMASNCYDGGTGTLSVKKLLALDPPQTDAGGDPVFPAVQMTLTRTYTKNNGEPSEAETVDTLPWSAEDVKKAYKQATEEAGGDDSVVLEHIFTFEGLELYAPNGSQYIYTVTEVKDNFLEGYETSWGNDDLEIESPTFQSGSEATPLSPTPVAEDPGAGGGEDVPDPGEAAPTDPAEEPEYVIAATFKNVPDTRTVVLEGKKTWKDFDNSFDLRPEVNNNGQSVGLMLTLYRSADSQPGQDNGIASVPVDEETYKVTWITNDDSNTWTYTITGEDGKGLPAYAPNGMPWKYSVKESLSDELKQIYTASPSSANETGRRETEGDDSTAFTGTMATLTNSMANSVSYSKRWEDNKGQTVTGDYIGAELTVAFQLQVRETAADGTSSEPGEWTSAETYFTHGDGGILTDDQWDAIFKNFNFDIEKQGHIGDSVWSGTIADLPKAIRKNGEEITYLEYRVVETSVTVAEQKQTITIQDDGTYTVTPESGFVLDAQFTSSGNITTNILDVQSLTITKNWAGDNNNAYGIRPASDSPNSDWKADFVIQRSTDGTSWENVQVYSTEYQEGRDLVITLTGGNTADSASATISGLPKGPYTYRARELQPEWTRDTNGKIPDKYILSGDGSYYEGTYQAQYKDNADGTTVTNTLQTRNVIAATKKWLPTTPQGVTVTLTLEYLSQENKWVPLKSVTLDGAADEESTGPAYEDTAWHAVWKDLPLYHPNGKNENGFTEYRVTETHTGDYVQVENQHEGNSYTFTNVPATQLRVVKTWYGTDLSNQKEVKVLLYRTTEGGTEEPVYESGTTNQRYLLLNADNGWQGVFANLPAYSAAGAEYQYYARETTIGGVPVENTGFDAEHHDGQGITHIINYGDGEQEDYVQVRGTKTWVDQDKTARDQLQLYLYRTTTPGNTDSWELVPETEVILRWFGRDGDQWYYSFENLPRCDADGSAYAYYVMEVSPDGYDGRAEEGVSLLAGGLFLYNFTNVQRGGLSVEKYVTGAGDTDKEFSFTVTLSGESTAGIPAADIDGTYGGMTFKDGAAVFTLKHGQSVTAENLPAGLTYTVTETEEAGYETSTAHETGTIPAGGTVTATFNNHKDPPGGGTTYTHVSVRKVWRLDDGGTAADSVTVHLLRGGTVADTVVLDADNSWTYTWTRLDDRYVWTVEEADVPDGFTAAVTRSGWTFTIINDDTGEPEDPEDPDEPPSPDIPEDPDQPTEPDLPDTPDTPDTPDVPENPDVPSTGDPTWNGPLALLCLTSLAGAVVLGILGLRRTRGRGKRLQ